MTTALDAATVQIGYLCRERLHGTLLAECNKLRTKRGDDPGILFWRGFALGFQVRPLTFPPLLPARHILGNVSCRRLNQGETV